MQRTGRRITPKKGLSHQFYVSDHSSRRKSLPAYLAHRALRQVRAQPAIKPSGSVYHSAMLSCVNVDNTVLEVVRMQRAIS